MTRTFKLVLLLFGWKKVRRLSDGVGYLKLRLNTLDIEHQNRLTNDVLLALSNLSAQRAASQDRKRIVRFRPFVLQMELISTEIEKHCEGCEIDDARLHTILTFFNVK